jgi:hypothetical protein
MGRVRLLTVAAAAIFAGIGLTAFSSEPGPPSTSTTGAQSSSTAAPPHHPRTHSLVGEVVEIQTTDQKLIVRETLRDGSPKTTTISTTPKTVVFRAADSAGLPDVHVNDHVTIKYREDAGKNKEAVSIRITPSAAPKAPKTPKPAEPAKSRPAR